MEISSSSEELPLNDLPPFEELAAQYSPLIESVIRKNFTPFRGFELDDLRQEALIALDRARTRWDERNGTYFAVYLQGVLVNQVRTYIRTHTPHYYDCKSAAKQSSKGYHRVIVQSYDALISKNTYNEGAADLDYL